MLVKITDDLNLKHELELKNQLAAQEREFNKQKQASLQQLKDELNSEFEQSKQKLTANFEQQLTKLAKNYKLKNKPPDNHVACQTDTEPPKDSKKVIKPKSAKKRVKSAKKPEPKPIEVSNFDVKPNPLQKVVEVKEYQIQRLVGENAYLRDRLSKLTIEFSDLKHEFSKTDKIDKVLTQNYGYNNSMVK